jgi:hypothetical protein
MSAHVLEQLGLYLDDELVPSDRAAVETHLRDCAECSKRLEEFAAVDDLARALPAEAPEGYFTDFAARVRGGLQGKPAARAPLRLPVWVLAAAAAVALGVTVPALLRRQSLEPSPAALPEETFLQRPAPVGGGAPEAAKPVSPSASERIEDEKTRLTAPPQAPHPARAKTGSPTQQEYAEPHGLAGGVAESVEGAAPVDASRDAEADALKKRDQVDEPRALGQLSSEGQAKAESSGYAPPPAAAASATPREEKENRRALADAPAPKLALEAARKDKAPGAAGARGRFGELLDRTATTAGEARALREAWRVHASLALGGEADEARVRVVEAGAQAYRLSHDLADLAQLEKDADAYLARPDALQVSRVRAVLLSVRSDRP